MKFYDDDDDDLPKNMWMTIEYVNGHNGTDSIRLVDVD